MHGTNDVLFHKDHPRVIIPELCKQFYRLGWFSANSGGLSIKQGKSIYITPNDVPKERLDPQDLFILKNDGAVSISPSNESLKISSFVPLFMKVLRSMNNGAVLVSHGKNAVLASMIYAGSEFKLKGVHIIEKLWKPNENRHYNVNEEVVIPIIEDTPMIDELSERMTKAMKAYPNISAVIVRRNGIIVWGENIERCKANAEAIDYLMDVAVDMEKMGINEYTHFATQSTEISAILSVESPAKETTPSEIPSEESTSVNNNGNASVSNEPVVEEPKPVTTVPKANKSERSGRVTKSKNSMSKNTPRPLLRPTMTRMMYPPHMVGPPPMGHHPMMGRPPMRLPMRPPIMGGPPMIQSRMFHKRKGKVDRNKQKAFTDSIIQNY